MLRPVAKRGPKRRIYVSGEFVDVRLIDGAWTADDAIYDLLPNGHYAKRGSVVKGTFQEIEIDYESAKLGDFVFWSDGSKSQWQPDENGNKHLVEIDSISQPELVRSLSPIKRQGYSDLTGSSK